jgi:hypothetical protein
VKLAEAPRRRRDGRPRPRAPCPRPRAVARVVGLAVRLARAVAPPPRRRPPSSGARAALSRPAFSTAFRPPCPR